MLDKRRSVRALAAVVIVSALVALSHRTSRLHAEQSAYTCVGGYLADCVTADGVSYGSACSSGGCKTCNWGPGTCHWDGYKNDPDAYKGSNP